MCARCRVRTAADARVVPVYTAGPAAAAVITTARARGGAGVRVGPGGAIAIDAHRVRRRGGRRACRARSRACRHHVGAHCRIVRLRVDASVPSLSSESLSPSWWRSASCRCPRACSNSRSAGARSHRGVVMPGRVADMASAPGDVPERVAVAGARARNYYYYFCTTTQQDWLLLLLTAYASFAVYATCILTSDVLYASVRSPYTLVTYAVLLLAFLATYLYAVACCACVRAWRSASTRRTRRSDRLPIARLGRVSERCIPTAVLRRCLGSSRCL